MKVLFCRFQEFSGLVNTFTAKGFSETSLVMHLNKHIFRSQSLQKYLSYETHFFLDHWKFHVDTKTSKKYNQNTMVFSLIWFELVTVNSLYYYENTRSWQSTCYQTVPKSMIWLNITFPNSISLRMMQN